MKKAIRIKISVLLFLAVLFPAAAEENNGVIVRVVTENKGPLKLRASASTSSRILDEIPNGTILRIRSWTAAVFLPPRLMWALFLISRILTI